MKLESECPQNGSAVLKGITSFKTALVLIWDNTKNGIISGYNDMHTIVSYYQYKIYMTDES